MKKHHSQYAILSLGLFLLAVQPTFGEEPTVYEGLIEPNQLVNVGTPVEGVAAKVNVQRSHLVQAGEPLAQMDPLRVEMILPAELFRKIQPGMQAEVTPESQGEGSYTSTVSTIVDRIIDAASGTFGVRLELPNPNYRLSGVLNLL